MCVCLCLCHPMAMLSVNRDKVISTHLTDMIGKVTGSHYCPSGGPSLLIIPIPNGRSICMKHPRDVQQSSRISCCLKRCLGLCGFLRQRKRERESERVTKKERNKERTV